MRMAKLNLKVSVAMMLSKFTFELSDESLYHEEVKFNPKMFPLQPANNILMKAIPR
jgi:hypothetical protein